MARMRSSAVESCFNPRKASDMDIKKLIAELIAVATGEIDHTGDGLCPDRIEGFDSRDPDCPACKILIEAAAEHDDLERRLREAEARVTARIDEAVEAEREACAKICTSEGVTEDECMAGQMFAREIYARNQPPKNVG